MKLEGIPNEVKHTHDVNLNITVDPNTLAGIQAISLTVGLVVVSTVFMKGLFHA